MSVTRVPKARVRFAAWLDSDERYRALVLVAGGQNFLVTCESAGKLHEVIEHELERAYGDNWEVVSAIPLGRADSPNRREIARLLEGGAWNSDSATG